MTETRWVGQSVHFDTRTDETDNTRLRTVATLAALEDGEFVPTDLLDGVECGYFSRDHAYDAQAWLADRGVEPEAATAMVSRALEERGRTIRLIDGRVRP